MGQAKARKVEIISLKQSPKAQKILPKKVSPVVLFTLDMARMAKRDFDPGVIKNHGMPSAQRITQELEADYRSPSELKLPDSQFLTPGSGTPLNCFYNCKAHIALHPEDTYQLGITYWESPNGLDIAELHSVIKHPDGSLEDVTAQLNPKDKFIHFTPV